QLEVINNDFYIYAKDINLVDTSFFKRKFFEDSSSKLTEKGISKVKTSFPNILNDSIDDNSHPVLCSKHIRIEYSDKSTDMFNNTVGNDVKLDKVNDLSEIVQNDYIENIS
ncbi:1983_t:CDS:2, partial [Scutellospora calospora]